MTGGHSARPVRWLGLLGFCLVACSHAPREPARPPGLLWPMPPEQPRYRYEASLRSPASVMDDDEPERLKRMLTGRSMPTETILEKPLAVAARGGRVFVADTVKRRIVVFDNPRRKVFEFGLRAPGELIKPLAIALDSRRQVYVADASRRQIVVYDDLGLYLRAFGAADELEHPVGVAVSPDGNRVYVVDRGRNESVNHRVQVYDAEGRHLRQIGTRGTADGQFNIPVQAAVGPEGRLYVLDAGNFRVQVFNADGSFMRRFGQAGNGLGQFSRPRGLAVDSDGTCYVSDAGFANLQVFDPLGRLLLPLGLRDLDGGPGRFVLPGGVAVDETGRVFVVDQYLRKVEVLKRLSDAEGLSLARGE